MSDHHVCSDAAFLFSLDGFELIPRIVRVLAEGEPVAVEEITASADLPVAEAERLLRSKPSTEWDDNGRLVGFGLTSRPTDHRFSVEGKSLYTVTGVSPRLPPSP